MWPDRVSTPGPLTYESGALGATRPGNKSEERLNKCVVVPNRATFKYSYSVTSIEGYESRKHSKLTFFLI